jgi:hypothetical protein
LGIPLGGQPDKTRHRPLFRLCNAASIYQQAIQSEFLSALEKDLDDLLKIGGEGATTCREAPIFDKYSDSDNDPGPFSGCHSSLTITTTPQDRFVY